MYIFTLRVVHYIIQALQLKAADCPGLRSCRTHLFLHSPDAGKIPYSSHALDAQPLFPFSAHDSPICALPQHSMLAPIAIYYSSASCCRPPSPPVKGRPKCRGGRFAFLPPIAAQLALEEPTSTPYEGEGQHHCRPAHPPQSS